MPACPPPARHEHRVILCAFNAHVRSVLQYGSVIWSGAAQSHLVRLERLQHCFLMWLGAKTQRNCPMDYRSLLQTFKTESIKARLIHTDVMFLYQLLHHRTDCAYLVSMFGLNPRQHGGGVDATFPPRFFANNPRKKRPIATKLLVPSH